MLWFYMNNFRGFERTLLPLAQTNFLIGENSTGKSSFMKLLNLFSDRKFWFTAQISPDDNVDLGGFTDIVSAASEDRSFFQVGVVRSTGNALEFDLLTFINKDDVPTLKKLVRYGSDKLLTITASDALTYRILDLKNPQSEDIKNTVFEILSHEEHSSETFNSFSKDADRTFVIFLSAEVAPNNPNYRRYLHERVSSPLFQEQFVWIAPIRSKPHRFYEARQRVFSPEGEHTPFVIRKTLTQKNRSTRFTKKLSEFGKASGLFETIIAHPFGNTPQAPFQLIVKFSGVDLNINNVGYGVSQVLPLIVEFLFRSKGFMFAVQQPEVHLHPKAQAALGDLIYVLSKEDKQSFLLETHSDYLINRFRLAMHRDTSPPSAQVLYFRRTERGNEVDIIPINPDGTYSEEQPEEFRDFFLNEEMALLEI